MSKIDSVFGPIPGPLMQEWGQSMVFVHVDGAGTYDSATGEITPSETRYNVKAVLTSAKPEEFQGVYQGNEIKILIEPAQIGGHYITTADYWEIPRDGSTQIAKVVEAKTFRGDSPVFFVCIARPQ